MFNIKRKIMNISAENTLAKKLFDFLTSNDEITLNLMMNHLEINFKDEIKNHRVKEDAEGYDALIIFIDNSAFKITVKYADIDFCDMQYGMYYPKEQFPTISKMRH